MRVAKPSASSSTQVQPRVLLKLSGEQFAGKRGNGVDPVFVDHLSRELAGTVRTTGAQLAIVVGGGNIMRGAAIAGHGLERTTGDYMGMLATVINGLALIDILEQNGQPARLQSRLTIGSVAEPYIRRRAIGHLEKGRVVVIAGGTGNPFVTTDTAAVSAALELDCQMVLKATKVDGIYDRDPAEFPDAKKLESLTFHQALTDSHISVMDNAAISLAMENHLPIVVFDLLTHGNVRRVIEGQPIGTRVE